MSLSLRKYDLTITFTTRLLGTRSRAYFHRDTHSQPVLLDRHIMGFLKEASASLADVLNSRSLTDKVFVRPRELALQLPSDTQVQSIERSRRLEGHRVAYTKIVSSEAAPIGTQVSCQLVIYPGFDEEVLCTLLDYGEYRGMGQFRGGGYGRFTYELVRCKGES